MSQDVAAAAIVLVLMLAAFTGSFREAPAVATTEPLKPAVTAQMSPPARAFHEMAYDGRANRIVLFGGYHFGCLNDTWTYDLGANTWRNMSPAAAPTARCAFAMAYDAESDRVILFGGSNLGSDFNDTWAYDLTANTWTNVSPAAHPPGRVGGRMVYDVRLDEAILFGGHTTLGYTVEFNDTWLYSYNTNTWRVATPTVSPPPHAGQAMAYDTESDRVVLFGGQVGTGTSASDSWAYDAVNDTWEQMAPPTHPPAAAWDAAVYDARADRILMFGGDDAGENQTWTYDFDANAWSKITTTSGPSDRVAHAMAYDASADRTVLFGGMWPSGPVSEPMLIKNRETWVYDNGKTMWTQTLGPLPPLAAFLVSPTNPLPGEVVTFDASASNDPDGVVVTHLWNFGDGTTSYVANPTHSYATPGTKTVSLTLTDDDGLTNTTLRQVLVRETVRPTVEVASPAEGAILTSATVTITGTASDNAGVARVEVSLDNATWTEATGTTSWSATLSLTEGANTIYVRVTDTSGNVATSTIHVTVATSGGTTGEQGITAWVWPVVVVGIAGVAAAAYLSMRRRRRRAA